MKRYQLFSEHNDIHIWGTDLADAVRRRKNIPRKGSVQNGTWVAAEPLVVKSVLGTRDTAGSTRGSWKYECAIVEDENGVIHEVDGREDGTLITTPQG